MVIKHEDPIQDRDIMILSKSLYMRGLQCRKSLYLDRYHPELRTEPTAALESLWRSGHEVGDYAYRVRSRRRSRTRCRTCGPCCAGRRPTSISAPTATTRTSAISRITAGSTCPSSLSLPSGGGGSTSGSCTGRGFSICSMSRWAP